MPEFKNHHDETEYLGLKDVHDVWGKTTKEFIEPVLVTLNRRLMTSPLYKKLGITTPQMAEMESRIALGLVPNTTNDLAKSPAFKRAHELLNPNYIEDASVSTDSPANWLARLQQANDELLDLRDEIENLPLEPEEY